MILRSKYTIQLVLHKRKMDVPKAASAVYFSVPMYFRGKQNVKTQSYEPLQLSHCKQKAQIAFSGKEIDRANAKHFIFLLPLEVMRVYLPKLDDCKYFSSTSFQTLGQKLSFVFWKCSMYVGIRKEREKKIKNETN